MILAIVGSSKLSESEKPAAVEIIRALLTYYDPHIDGFTSGGADGVDTIACYECMFIHGYSVEQYIFYPEVKQWNDGPNGELGFKSRNKLVAEKCDVLWRIASRDSKTFGSGWTKKYAAELGKETYEVLL